MYFLTTNILSPYFLNFLIVILTEGFIPTYYSPIKTECKRLPIDYEIRDFSLKIILLNKNSGLIVYLEHQNPPNGQVLFCMVQLDYALPSEHKLFSYYVSYYTEKCYI